ncbi:hypothetical protein [Pseudomonas sp. NPDC089401]|uniref:hypothetical protein n=1 Tax=Pseudomonas sp. NPDC089401 TaxID=3364462 RepID=UPI0037FB07AE
MIRKFLKIGLISAVAATAACSNGLTQPAPPAKPAPAGTPFAKIKPGMSLQQVHDLIGQPTENINTITGKAYIPFYFGNDATRIIDLYKGQGRIVYTGAGATGVNFRVHEVRYDKSESGYNSQ